MECEQDEQAWGLWQSLFPFMHIRWVKPVTFDDFKRELLRPRPVASNKSAAEIEAELQAVIAQWEGR